MTRICVPLIACTVTLAAAWAQPAAPEVAGYVFGVQGKWELAPQFGAPLSTGVAVYVGSRIQLKSPGRPAHLDIGLVNGKLLTRDCDTEQNCPEVDIPSAVRHETTFMERVRGMFSGFSAHQPPPVFTLTRGAGPQPAEAVLSMSRGQADLGPALQSAPAGTWDVALIPAGEDRPIASAHCRWSPQAAPCMLPAPKTGLYQLQIGAADTPPAGVLVLLVDPPDFRRAADAFADAVRLADSWGPTVRPATRHYFLGAVLTQLAYPRAH